MNKNIFGVILIALGLLITLPFMPKIIIFILGIYLIIMGARLLKMNQ